MDIREIISSIKSLIRIEDIIGRYINLKKSGKNYVANCPFHNDRTPSFTVSPDKGIFHCFGCGKTGDVITFVMEIEKISFMEAVRKIGKEAGIDVDSNLSKTSKSRSIILSLKQLNIEAQKFFSYYLTKGDKQKIGIKYLKSRKIDSKTAKKFKFGMAPSSKDLLYRYLKSKFFTDETIFESRLVVNTTSGPIDLLRNRLTFPIENEYGDIVGFAGRTLSEDTKEPKYINLPETPIFKKRQILFGLNNAKSAIRETGRVFLVEGYFDVISLHRKGIENVCGVMGTSLTVEQLRLISNIAKEVYLFFDSDNAGINAVERAVFLIMNNSDLDVKVVKVSQKDPDEFVKFHDNKGDVVDEKLLLSNSMNVIDFFIETHKDLISSGDKNSRMSLVLKFFSLVSVLRNLYDKEEALKKISETMGISQSIVRSEFEKYQNRQRITIDNIVVNYSNLSLNTLELILAYMISKNNILIETLKSEVDISDIRDETARSYLSFLENYLISEEIDDETINQLYLLQSEVESKAAGFIRTYSENIKEDFDFLLSLYKIKNIRERKKEIQAIIERVSKDTTDQEILEELLEEKHVLAMEEKKIKELRKISY